MTLLICLDLALNAQPWLLLKGLNPSTRKHNDAMGFQPILGTMGMKEGLLPFLFEALGKMKASHLFTSTVLDVPHVCPNVTSSPLQGAGPGGSPFSQAYTCSHAFLILTWPLTPTSVTPQPREWLPGLQPGLLPDGVTHPICFFHEEAPARGRAQHGAAQGAVLVLTPCHGPGVPRPKAQGVGIGVAPYRAPATH